MTIETPAKPETALVPGTREAPALTPFEVIEKVVGSGDLSNMAPEARVAFYWRTCESLGLNPMTRPFDFIRGDDGKIIMYAKRDATDQLRAKRHVSIDSLDRKTDEEVCTVEARGSIIDPAAPGGIRRDSALGSVYIKGLGGQTRANAVMKAETKAKRRLTLSLVGLGVLDETEIEGIGIPLGFDPETGTMTERPAAAAATPTSLAERVAAQAAMLEEDGETIEGTATEVVEEAAATEPLEAAPEPEVAPDATPAAEAPAAPAPVAATDTCADPSPYDDGGVCGLKPGHLEQPRAPRVHRQLDADGKVIATWPAKGDA